MVRAVADIERDILALDDGDKETLLRTLIGWLDGPADPDVEQAWLSEVQRRSRELDEGITKTISAEEAITQARRKLKQR